MLFRIRTYCPILLLALILVSTLKSVAQTNYADSVFVSSGTAIEKSIYTDPPRNYGSFYKWAWGEHYRDLYYKPISVKPMFWNTTHGSLSLVSELQMLHAYILESNRKQLYMVKPLGGSSSFLESKFFRDIYNPGDFKDTYLDEFIKDAYTVIHPYMFIVTENLAKSADFSGTESRIYYMTENIPTDSITEDGNLKDRMVSLSLLPEMKREDVISDVTELMDSLHRDNNTFIDRDVYIKSRLFDMLIGDWNKTSENWYWIPRREGGKTIYSPEVVDRSHAFSKVDGVLFKEMLRMLGLGFMTNYEVNCKNLKKFNGLAYPMDIALAQYSTAADWQRQARELKVRLTDEEIDKAFERLPLEMRSEETVRLQKVLKERREHLEDMALRYYKEMQKNPVIAGTDMDDRFEITQDDNNNLRIKIYDAVSDSLLMDKKYIHKDTKEIWIYGLGGNDIFQVDKKRRNIGLLLIGGKGANDYRIDNGSRTFVYETKTEKERLDSLPHAKVIIPNDEEALEYNYEKQRYSSFSFTPIGLYDSDLGLNIGTSVAYTIYGFRRAPYTRRHQISYDFQNGLTYQGIFPSYDEHKRFHVIALMGSPAYFSNFFGFGNNTSGYKSESRKYNRVHINKYMLAPSFHYNVTKEQEVNVYSSFEVYDVKNPDGRNRFINKYYGEESDVFSAKYFVNLGAQYAFNKKMKGFVSSLSFSASAGWNVNIARPKNNYAFATGQAGVNLRINDRITFATQFKGRLLFSDDYEFYQAATTELRGFRDNRFIGRYSFYQYSDIRLDMGRLDNPFTPLDYGVFVGVDHGRVWYPDDNSDMWHSSYGGGFWLTLFRNFTGKFSYFGSSDGGRFMFQLGMGF